MGTSMAFRSNYAALPDESELEPVDLEHVEPLPAQAPQVVDVVEAAQEAAAQRDSWEQFTTTLAAQRALLAECLGATAPGERPSSSELVTELYGSLQRSQTELQSKMTASESDEEIVQCLAIHESIAAALQTYARLEEAAERSEAAEVQVVAAAARGVETDLMEMLGSGGQEQHPQLVKTNSVQEFEDFFSGDSVFNTDAVA